ncbi:sugar transferase [Anaerostipes caccae]|nr:sugar transferase [Anaerostipes caccae]MCB6335174.1 sugar transferase [Anaerostipes caccae]MCB6338278.1 sugar transferase [Anaerostipes caccae]MCB6352798.1 sugar transferase [Anaerostipes caccae]MCB6358577.1 sugar transferase [Anaerostipes caccae]
MYRRFIKRLLDLLISSIGLIIISPIFIIICILVRINLGTPIFFKQERPGLNEKIFSLYKFRTMKDATGADGRMLPDELRLTPFGRKLRATSLDELPELINIIKGDMSFIGPRPLLVRYLPFYTEEEHARHSVRPGLTGLAQVNGRNNLPWEERFRIDLNYISNVSFKEDLSIFVQTIQKVLLKEDICSGNEQRLLDLDEERKAGVKKYEDL